MGKAKGCIGPKESRTASKEACTSPQRSLCSQANESLYEEKTVSDDESEVGGEEEGVGRVLSLALPTLSQSIATAARDDVP